MLIYSVYSEILTVYVDLQGGRKVFSAVYTVFCLYSIHNCMLNDRLIYEAGLLFNKTNDSSEVYCHLSPIS